MVVMPMPQWDVDHLTESAFLYAFGRQTYAASTMIEIIIRNSGRLSPETRVFVSKTIGSRLKDMRQPSDLARGWAIVRNVLDRQHTEPPLKPSGLVITDSSLLVMFACAFRYDMDNPDKDYGDDVSAPVLWERYAHEHARLLKQRKWSYVTARDLVNARLIPSSEPLGRIPEIERPHLEGNEPEPDDRWLQFFRLMRDANENNKEGQR